MADSNDKLRVSIVGGSGYTGGELVRLLLFHPRVELQQVTSRSSPGKRVASTHPNLRKVTDLKYVQPSQLEKCDFIFTAMHHGESMKEIPKLLEFAPRIADLSADFRLRNANGYPEWYGFEHSAPELLKEAVYGIPELHREEMRKARIVSGAGCLATASILGLYPLFKNGLIEGRVSVDGKVGRSATGTTASEASHHPDRSHAVRSYAPTGHRHTAEMEQELSFNGIKPEIDFSPHAVELVRGISITSQVRLKQPLEEIDVWKVYRKEYGKEPFIRIVKETSGNFRYPEPKLLWGSNYCDVGFEREKRSNRLVVMSAIDNMMKGASGQAVQCMNAMMGFPETTGLEFPGMHPI